MMMIITMKNILLLVCTISLASGFVVTNPSGSATRRLDRTRTYIAAAPMKDDIRKTTTIPSGPKRHQITTINSVEEYERFLPAEDRLTLIRFHASWCKTCKAQGLQFTRIAKEVGDLVVRDKYGIDNVVVEGDVRFAEIEFGANKELCNLLGVTKLPTVNFYSQGNKVDGFPCGPKKLKLLLEKISQYRDMSSQELQFEADMNKGVALSAIVLETLQQEQPRNCQSDSSSPKSAFP